MGWRGWREIEDSPIRVLVASLGGQIMQACVRGVSKPLLAWLLHPMSDSLIAPAERLCCSLGWSREAACTGTDWGPPKG